MQTMFHGNEYPEESFVFMLWKPLTDPLIIVINISILL